jgi:hypothetical protein
MTSYTLNVMNQLYSKVMNQLYSKAMNQLNSKVMNQLYSKRDEPVIITFRV